MSDRERVVRALERAGERAVVKVVLDLHSNLIAAPQEGGTPIDTGWASANWIPETRRPTRFNGSRSGSPDAGAVAFARSEQQRGLASVLQFRLSDGVVFVSNGTDYIGILNDSHPVSAGFVDRGVAKALRVDLRGLDR